MILEPKDRVVWRGNLWSDIVFEATSCDIPTSYVGFRVYLEITKANKTTALVPCSRMDFSGRPNFHFLPNQPAKILGQSFTPELSSVCSFLFNNKCLVGARVHHDILNDDSISFKLLILLATKTNKQMVNDIIPPLKTTNIDDIINRFRLESSVDAKLLDSHIDVCSCRSDDLM